MPARAKSPEPPTAAAPPRRRYAARRPRQERREQILDATLALIAREGFEALTIDRVAGDARIAKSVVYAIFSSRDGLLDALMTREHERGFALAAAALEELSGDGDLVSGCLRALMRFLDGVAARPDTWRLVLLPVAGMPTAVRDAILDGREQWRRRIEPLAQGLLESAGLDGVDPELVAHLARGNAEYVARLMLEDPDVFTRERIERFAADISSRLPAFDSAAL